jgi:hypothetical protein
MARNFSQPWCHPEFGGRDCPQHPHTTEQVGTHSPSR